MVTTTIDWNHLQVKKDCVYMSLSEMVTVYGKLFGVPKEEVEEFYLSIRRGIKTFDYDWRNETTSKLSVEDLAKLKKEISFNNYSPTEEDFIQRIEFALKKGFKTKKDMVVFFLTNEFPENLLLGRLPVTTSYYESVKNKWINGTLDD